MCFVFLVEWVVLLILTKYINKLFFFCINNKYKMGGGLLQLVAYGAQDVYLTGNPQITFFKVVYRRHTNFSIESIQQTFNGNASANNRVTCQISRNGDLVHKLYVVFDTVNVDDARKCIKKVEVEIGGQLIDRQYGDWMTIWNELTLPKGKKDGYDYMIDGTASTAAYVPLEFWFCRNIGLALPLIALQYHEVKINIEFTSTGFSDATLWADYIFLDTDERRRFAQLSHEYLIEQVQFTGGESLSSSDTTLSAKLSFNHPVKELIWQRTDSDGTTHKSTGKAKLMLNGNDRFAERDAMYFTHVQPYQHHTNIPAQNKWINVYSFGLKPEEHQPSGTLNMSRIDTAQLKLSSFSEGAGEVKIYAHSYNVLRILSGMGGLAYSN
jgi:hypothetical protein